MNYYQSFEALRRNFFVSLQKNKKTKKKQTNHDFLIQPVL